MYTLQIGLVMVRHEDLVLSAGFCLLHGAEIVTLNRNTSVFDGH
jgi:hypothetical protein